MPRLRKELLDRTKTFSHRVVDVAEALAGSPPSARLKGRVIDQIVGAGTSVAANTREADEAMSRPDFAKSIATVLKELSECGFWLEFIGERNWVRKERLQTLLQERDELAKIFSTMQARTKKSRTSK